MKQLIKAAIALSAFLVLFVGPLQLLANSLGL